MDLLPRHFSLFQFRVGSWFIASSVPVAALTGECWRLNGSQDYKRQSQSERRGPEECFSEIINALPLGIIWLVPPADSEILRYS